jgi:hypothetical protein
VRLGDAADDAEPDAPAALAGLPVGPGAVERLEDRLALARPPRQGGAGEVGWRTREDGPSDGPEDGS